MSCNQRKPGLENNRLSHNFIYLEKIMNLYVCLYCNAPLVAQGKKYCSNACYAEHNHQKRIEEYNKFPKLCIECGTTFDYKSRGKTFCSMKCTGVHGKKTGAYKSEAHNGDKNAHYGKTWISNLEQRICISIKKEDVSAYLEQGFIHKRVINFDKYIEKQKPKINNKQPRLKILKTNTRHVGGTKYPSGHPIFLPDRMRVIAEFCKAVLDKNTDYKVTWEDLSNTKEIINTLLHEENLSPREIDVLLGLNHYNLADFIRKSLKLKLKNSSQSVKNYVINSGKARTDAKEIYQAACKFKFDPWKYSNIPGYDLLLKYEIYNVHNNRNGVTRDHMLSIECGWRNDIDPKIISHPANCQYLSLSDNSSKNSSSILTITELNNRIEEWDNNKELQLIKMTPRKFKQERSVAHRKNLSVANMGSIIITNGMENKKFNPNGIIPNGYWRGCTRKNKLKVFTEESRG